MDMETPPGRVVCRWDSPRGGPRHPREDLWGERWRDVRHLGVPLGQGSGPSSTDWLGLSLGPWRQGPAWGYTVKTETTVLGGTQGPKGDVWNWGAPP